MKRKRVHAGGYGSKRSRQLRALRIIISLIAVLLIVVAAIIVLNDPFQWRKP